MKSLQTLIKPIQNIEELTFQSLSESPFFFTNTLAGRASVSSNLYATQTLLAIDVVSIVNCSCSAGHIGGTFLRNIPFRVYSNSIVPVLMLSQNLKKSKSTLIMELFLLFPLYLAAMLISVALRRRKTMIIALIPCLAVLSNIMGSARILSMPFNLSVPAGIVPFMLSFFLIDVINEFFNEKDARDAVISGLIAVGISVLVIWVSILWSPASFSPEGFAEMMALTPGLFFAALLSFGVSSYVDILIYSAIRKRTGKNVLWLRENVSTIVSIITANLIFLPIGYYGTGYPLLNMMAGHTVAQVIIALLDTPFIYCIRYIYGMMDLAKVQKILKNKSFVAVKEGSVVFESEDKGLKPFIDAIDSADLEGSLIGDRIIGKASALLACYSRAYMLYAPRITEEALAYLNREGIKIKYEEIVNMRECVYDVALKGVEDPEKAYVIIKGMMKNG